MCPRPLLTPQRPGVAPLADRRELTGDSLPPTLLGMGLLYAAVGWLRSGTPPASGAI